MILSEFADNDINNISYDDEIYTNILQQFLITILSFHTTLYNGKKMFLNNIKVENILYKKIEKGGYFKYIINGKEVFIENLGYLVILWNFANTVTNIHPNSNYSGNKIYYTSDYMSFIKFFKYKFEPNKTLKDTFVKTLHP